MNEELIARLEAASGPDEWADKFIHLTRSPGATMLDFECGRLAAPAYTSSIDAALTLCGGTSGLGSLISGHFTDGSPGWVARVRSPQTADGEGATPALAICIAALRAKEKTDG